MRFVTHDEIVKHGLLYTAKEFYQFGYSSLVDVFEKFESTHELLNRYEDIADRPIRFKDECLFRYKKNKEIIVAERRYLTDKIFHDKIINAFRDIRQNHKYDLTAGIEGLYMKIDFVMNELIDHISKSCKSYKVRRHAGNYLELVNISDDNMRFVCNKNSLKGFQGYVKGKGVIRRSCPMLADNEEWSFDKRKNSDGVVYIL